jgi:hypothetical protein
MGEIPTSRCTPARQQVGGLVRVRGGVEGGADSEMPEDPGKGDGFFSHFTEELRNQFRGTPTEPPPPTPKQPPAKEK